MNHEEIIADFSDHSKEELDEVLSKWIESMKNSPWPELRLAVKGMGKLGKKDILKAMHTNWKEHERLLKMADEQGIHDLADRVGGGWLSLESALEQIGESDDN